MRETRKKFARHIGILTVCLTLLLPAARLTARDQKQTVEFRSLQLSLMELMESIQNQTDFVFAVNLSRIDIQYRVTLSAHILPVATAMDEALTGTDQKYVINGRQIVVFHKDDPRPVSVIAQEPPSVNIARVSTAGDFNRAVSEYMSENPGTRPSQEDERAVRYDTIRRPVPHDGNYTYGDRSLTLSFMRDRIDAPRKKLPLLKLKTNLLYGGVTLTPNLSGEVGLGRRTSLEAMGSWNPWHRKGTAESNRKLAHIVAKSEFRYWLCERFNGHYFGAHAFFWRYNIGTYDIPLLFEKEYRYDGRAVGIGVSYGYYWPWTSRWGMEFNVGAGVAFMKYDRYDCDRCQDTDSSFKKTYFGPTSAGIKIVFRIK